MAIGIPNTLPRSSCGKCVRVLKELLKGLDESSSEEENSNDNGSNNTPAPLTLLRAIARSNHPQHDPWGQRRRHKNDDESNRSRRYTTTRTREVNSDTGSKNDNERPQLPMLTMEETGDGVKLTIPVETTAPAKMKKWTHLQQQVPVNTESTEAADNDNNHSEEQQQVLEDWMPLATSVRTDDDDTDGNAATIVHNPLTIELLCRKCENSGPEAGARAFLMGPQPLSIVLCHNRIDSELHEVEEILTHELIHLYDVQTLQLDLSDCETVAYSEVRAAREAECHKGFLEAAKSANKDTGLVNQITQTLEKHVYKPYCVKNIALGATQNMFPSKGKSCLNKVWEQAYADHRPFGRKGTQEEQSSSLNEEDEDGSTSTNLRHKESSGTIDGMSDK